MFSATPSSYRTVLYDDGVASPCVCKDCILIAVMMHVRVAQLI